MYAIVLSSDIQVLIPPFSSLVKHETSIRGRLQGRELKPFSCMQVQDHLWYIDFTSEREVYVRFLSMCSFYESHVHIFER